MAINDFSFLKGKDAEFKPLGPKQHRTYKLLGVHIDPATREVICPNTLQVGNTFVVRDKDQVKTFVYVKSINPSLNSDNIPKHMMGEIVFERAAVGEITCYGDNPADLEKDKALFFHQSNRSNIGKEWHVPPPSGNYQFELLDKRKKAESDSHDVETHSTCVQIIKDMTPPAMRDTYEIVYQQTHEGLELEEVKQFLYDYIKTPQNAENFITLSKSETIKVKAIIREAFEKKFIKEDESGAKVVWTTGNEVIATKIPRKTMEASLVTHFATKDGRLVLERLKELTEAKN
jgi:hypothetical protein